ncbi:MAG: two-component regulator propeller domain-containing protein [Acidobacteriota bacterium]
MTNALDPAKSLEQYSHRIWDLHDGLPHDSVRAIVQDTEGYLWLGTQAGLARFDGRRFEVYDRSTHPILGDGHIEALAFDARGSLWIGTYHGLLRFSQGRMRRFEVADGLPGSRILSLRADGETLWIGTYEGGLARLRGGRITPFRDAGGVVHPIVPDVAKDPRDDSLWVATFGGLHHFDSRRPGVLDMPTGLLSQRIWDLQPRDDGSLWVATDRGLHHLVDGAVRASFTPADGLSHARTLSVLEDRHGQIWVGTFGGGLNRLGLDGRWSHLKPPVRGHDAIFWTLFEDREGNLWGGTLLDGLHRFRAGAFTLFDPTQGLAPGVADLAERPGGELLFAIPGRGLVELDLAQQRSRRWATEDGLPSDEIVAIEIVDETVWVADREHLWWHTVDAPAWHRLRDVPSGIHDLTVSPDGSLWIATGDGAFRVDSDATFDERVERFGRADGLPTDDLRLLHHDRVGRLWLIGRDSLTLDSGADREGAPSTPRFRSLTLGSDLIRAPITALWGEADGDLWIGTAGDGLVRLAADDTTRSDPTPQMLTTLDGLIDDNIDELRGDDQGHLWINGSRGVARLPIDALEAKLADPSRPLVQTAYHRSDGLGGPAHGAASLRDSRGRLWFATAEGVAMVDPALLVEPALPTPRIEALLVDGRAIPLTPPPKLDPAHRDVELRFSAPALTARDRIRLRHRLIGLDETWVDAGDERTAELTHLPAGRYVFEVVASGADSEQTSRRARLAFEVEPAFAETRAFRATAGLSLLLVVYLGHLARIRGLSRWRRRLEHDVQQALARVKVLRGMLPICGRCKQIRDDDGFWNDLESYLADHSELQLETDLCPDCAAVPLDATADNGEPVTSSSSHGHGGEGEDEGKGKGKGEGEGDGEDAEADDGRMPA